MLKTIDVLNLSYDDFRALFNERKYSNLIQRKMKIIISMALAGYIDTKKIYIIERVGDDDVEDDIVEFVNTLNMKWCEMNRGGVFTQFAKSEAKDELKKINPGETVMLREFVLTDYCGYATRNAMGNTYIEVRKGGFYSFWEAKGIPTYYILDKDKNVITSREHATERFVTFDYKKRSWDKFLTGDIEKVTLSGSELDKITNILSSVSKTYRNAKIAWIKSGEEIIVFDIWIMFNQGILE